MADKSLDPMAAWRDLLGQWEKTSNEIANKMMSAPEFSRVFNAASGSAVGVRNTLSEAMTRYLVTMNMPTRADVIGLGERLQAVEAQLAHITALLEKSVGLPDAVSSAATGVSRPPRTKTPPAPPPQGGDRS